MSVFLKSIWDNNRGLRETEDDNKGIFVLDRNSFDPKECGEGEGCWLKSTRNMSIIKENTHSLREKVGNSANTKTKKPQAWPLCQLHNGG